MIKIIIGQKGCGMSFSARRSIDNTFRKEWKSKDSEELDKLTQIIRRDIKKVLREDKR